MLKLALCLAIAALTVACGGAAHEESPLEPSQVAQAFASEGITLTNTGLFGREDSQSHIEAAFFGTEPQTGDTFFVTVFDTEETAKIFAVPEASPSEDASRVLQARNVVTYLPESTDSRVIDAILADFRS